MQWIFNTLKIYGHYHVVQWQVSRALAVLSLCAATYLDFLHTIVQKVAVTKTRNGM